MVLFYLFIFYLFYFLVNFYMNVIFAQLKLYNLVFIQTFSEIVSDLSNELKTTALSLKYIRNSSMFYHLCVIYNLFSA